MRTFDRIAGIAAAIAATIGITWLSQMPVASGDNAGSLLRLAWRARPERIERCETQSPEALAALPAHMRQTLVCEGINASYRLEVRRDGVLMAEQLVEPGGLRRDRPLYVFREIAVPVGDATISITFVRVEPPTAEADDARDTDENSDDDGRRTERRRGDLTEAVPTSLAWEERLHFAPGHVRVISYDPEQRQLFEVRRE
jgi:hypothetical protein